MKFMHTCSSLLLASCLHSQSCLQDIGDGSLGNCKRGRDATGHGGPQRPLEFRYHTEDFKLASTGESPLSISCCFCWWSVLGMAEIRGGTIL